MQYSVIKKSKCPKYDFGYFLLSPEFFLDDKLKCWKMLERNSKQLVQDCFFHIRETVNEIDEKVICYDLTDGLPKFFDNGIEINHIKSPKKIANENDFLISRLRSYLEEMGIVEYRDKKQLFSTEFLVFRGKTNHISTSTLFAICMTKFVQTILKRGQYGTEHPRCYDFLLTHLPISNCLFSIDSHIKKIIQNALKVRQSSREIYKEAQEFLLAELGLTNWQPKHELAFIKNYSDTEQAGRIDADYYQPKYEEIENAIKSYAGGWDSLGNICTTKRGSLIKNSFYDENSGIPYIRGADFSGGSLSKNKLVFINSKFESNSETSIIENDIVFSLIGSVGETALVTKEYSNSYISNNTGRIRIKNTIKPMILQILLHSVIGKMYFEKYKTRTAQPKISDKDIHNFVLPILSESKQTKIQKKVTESFTLREQSKHLLECAKQAVEIAIEQNEQTAIDWLEEKRILF